MAKSATGKVRIIGGAARSRMLKFQAIDGLRPTPDRARETLFNWLQNDIAGARCLDLFAGSGALGFEALSRGAESVVMVESHASVFRDLESNLNRLGLSKARLFKQRAESFLRQAEGTFDIVFLDPPYQSALITACLTTLIDRGLLADGALIYIERSGKQTRPELPGPLRPLKQQVCGDVRGELLCFTPPDLSEPLQDGPDCNAL